MSSPWDEEGTLTGTVELWNGALVAVTFHDTYDTDENECRIYQATLPIFVDEQGAVQLVRRMMIDELPAHSTARLAFDPALPEVTVHP